MDTVILNMIKHLCFYYTGSIYKTDIQMEEPMRKDVLLDLVLANKEALIGNVKAGGILGYSDHSIVEFSIL